jgi:CBS domain-containing protein
MVAEIIPHVGAMHRLQLAIHGAASVDDLARQAHSVCELMGSLLHADAGPTLVTRSLSQLNDEIAIRVLQLLQPKFRLPPARWCWLGLGSQGRLEQTLSTDQDNGLLFSAHDDGEAHQLRQLFLPFAQEVNQALAQCGFSLCDGEVMAGNARWCLSLAEWKRSFSAWIRTPEPDALLNASIFFDFRLIVGDTPLADELRRYLAQVAAGNEIFLRMMATNALAAQPPLGRLRDFDSAEPDGRINLKKVGSRIFVDAARIFALGAGIVETNTLDRLRRAAQERVLSDSHAAAACGAFQALQGIRFVNQMQSAVTENLLDPDSLNDFDRKVLLESLKQARVVQQKLKTRFQLDG